MSTYGTVISTLPTRTSKLSARMTFGDVKECQSDKRSSSGSSERKRGTKKRVLTWRLDFTESEENHADPVGDVNGLTREIPIIQNHNCQIHCFSWNSKREKKISTK